MMEIHFVQLTLVSPYKPYAQASQKWKSGWSEGMLYRSEQVIEVNMTWCHPVSDQWRSGRSGLSIGG